MGMSYISLLGKQTFMPHFQDSQDKLTKLSAITKDKLVN